MRIFLIASLFFAGCVNAAIVDYGSFTTDTESGLDWLDVDQTLGYSYYDILPELEAGGLYEGWQLADRAQVTGFLNNAGGNGIYNHVQQFDHVELVDNMLNLWGTTFDGGGYIRLGEERSPSTVYAVFIVQYNSNDYGDLIQVGGSLSKDNAQPFEGVALVRSSVVPIPAAAWLFGSALAGLGWIRRKQAV